MRCTAQSHSLTVASKDVSLPLVAFPAPCVPSSRITGVCPSDSSSVLFYLNFKSSFKLIYALRLLPSTPVTWQPSRIVAVMLMQGDGMLLAFEVWRSPLLQCLSSQLKAGCVLGPFTPCRKNTCYQVCMQEALMSCVVVLMSHKEVVNVLLKLGNVRKFIFLKIMRTVVYFQSFPAGCVFFSCLSK